MTLHMSNSFKFIFANTFNWLVAILAIDLRGIVDWLTIIAIISAVVVSFLTALKIRSEYQLSKLRKEEKAIDIEIKNQQLVQERMKTKNLYQPDKKP